MDANGRQPQNGRRFDLDSHNAAYYLSNVDHVDFFCRVEQIEFAKLKTRFFTAVCDKQLFCQNNKPQVCVNQATRRVEHVKNLKENARVAH